MLSLSNNLTLTTVVIALTLPAAAAPRAAQALTLALAPQATVSAQRFATAFEGGVPELFRMAPGSAALPPGVALDPFAGVLSGYADQTTPQEPRPVLIRGANAAGFDDLRLDVSVSGDWEHIDAAGALADRTAWRAAHVSPGKTDAGEHNSTVAAAAYIIQSTTSGQSPTGYFPAAVTVGEDYRIAWRGVVRDACAIEVYWASAVGATIGAPIASYASGALRAVSGGGVIWADEPLREIRATAPAGAAFIAFRALNLGNARWLAVEQATLSLRGPSAANPTPVKRAPTAAPSAPLVGVAPEAPVAIDLSASFSGGTTQFRLGATSDPLPAGLVLDQSGHIVGKAFEEAAASLVVEAGNDVGDWTALPVELVVSDNPNVASGVLTFLGDGVARTPGAGGAQTLSRATAGVLLASRPMTVEPLAEYAVSATVDTRGLAPGRQVRLRIGRADILNAGASSGEGAYGGFLAERLVLATGGVQTLDLMVVADNPVNHIGFFSPDMAAGESLTVLSMTAMRIDDAVAPGRASPTPSDAITHRGVTYRLSAPAPWGRYVDGTPWVANPEGGAGLSIVSISPAPKNAQVTHPEDPLSAEGQLARRYNGAMLNSLRVNGGDERPAAPNGSGSGQAGNSGYAATLNVDPGFTGQPIAFAPGAEATVVKFVGLDVRYASVGQQTTDYHVPLTVVRAVPANDSFRPAVSAADKTPPATLAALNANLWRVPTLTWAATVPEAERMSGTAAAALVSWLHNGDHKNITGSNSEFGRRTGGTYGRFLAQGLSDAFIALLTETNADVRRRIAIGLVQIGLDYAYGGESIEAGGETFYPVGGNIGFRDVPVAFAALMTGNAVATRIADRAQSRVLNTANATMRVTPLLIATTDLGRPYPPATLGMPEWMEAGTNALNPETQSMKGQTAIQDKANSAWLASYRNLANNSQFGARLAAHRIAGLLPLFGSDTVAQDYWDRNFLYDHPLTGGADRIPSRHVEMWRTHRSAGAPVAAHAWGLALTDDTARTPALRPAQVGVPFSLNLGVTEFFVGVLPPVTAPTSYAIGAPRVFWPQTGASTSPASALAAVGLTLDPNTGVLSGTPTGPLPLSWFDVIATNGSGSARAVIALEVTG